MVAITATSQLSLCAIRFDQACPLERRQLIGGAENSSPITGKKVMHRFIFVWRY